MDEELTRAVVGGATDCQPIVSQQTATSVLNGRPCYSLILRSPPVKALAALDPALRGFGLDRRLDTGRLAFKAGLASSNPKKSGGAECQCGIAIIHVRPDGTCNSRTPQRCPATDPSPRRTSH